MKETIEKELCEITRKSIEGLIKAIKDKKSTKIDNAILLWNAVDYYNERCEVNEEDSNENEPIPPKYYM